MKRKFEIELNVPDNFDERYNPPYLLGPGCVITNGMLAWNVYADAKTPTPRWRAATAADEGKQARVKDVDGTCAACKLLHVDNHDTLMPYLVMLKGSTSVGWFKVCEVLYES